MWALRMAREPRSFKATCTFHLLLYMPDYAVPHREASTWQLWALMIELAGVKIEGQKSNELALWAIRVLL